VHIITYHYYAKLGIKKEINDLEQMLHQSLQMDRTIIIQILIIWLNMAHIPILFLQILNHTSLCFHKATMNFLRKKGIYLKIIHKL
jgi:hypothetical protein